MTKADNQRNYRQRLKDRGLVELRAQLSPTRKALAKYEIEKIKRSLYTLFIYDGCVDQPLSELIAFVETHFPDVDIVVVAGVKFGLYNQGVGVKNVILDAFNQKIEDRS